MSKRINVCVIGLGNCATSLITGVSKYSKNKSLIGLNYEDIGGYKVDDIHFVLGFDIDKRKIGKSIAEAIQQKPNCTPLLCSKETLESCPNISGKVYMGPVLDGFPKHMLDFPEDKSFRVAEEHELSEEEIKILLKANDVNVIVNYLPTGSQKATEFWATMCLETKIPFMNCIPVFIASDPVWSNRFKDAGVLVSGDDMQSQLGSSIVSSRLQSLFLERGLKVNMHSQLNLGGNTDFITFLDPSRLSSKKISKENVIKNQYKIAEKDYSETDIFAGPNGYIPYHQDHKIAYINLEAEGFGGQKVSLDCKLQVTDSSNSAGVVIDTVRFLALARDLGMKGNLLGPSVLYQKSPLQAISFETAKEMCDELAKTKVAPKLYEGID